jgi:hypothetical protein
MGCNVRKTNKQPNRNYTEEYNVSELRPQNYLAQDITQWACVIMVKALLASKV